MTRHFCDICGQTTGDQHVPRKTTFEIGQILVAGDVEDICEACLTAAEQVDWGAVVKDTIRKAAKQ